MKPRPPARPAAELESHLGYWLRLVSNRVSGSFARTLQQQQLSVAEWVAMNQIEAGANQSSAGLADVMDMTRGAVSKILDKLQQREWIGRTPDGQDSRIQLLSLTRQGRRELPELKHLADRNDADFFGVLSKSEQAMLAKLLRKVAAAHQIHKAPVD